MKQKKKSPGDEYVTKTDLVVFRKDILRDIDASMEIKFESFRHDIVGAFKDAIGLLSDKIDRQTALFMNHENRIVKLETKVGFR